MTITYTDPVARVVQVAQVLWPDLPRCRIEFVDGLTETAARYGETIWPLDEPDPDWPWPDGVDAIIQIDSKIPFEGLIDIMAHEIAHVRAGYDAQHDDTWAAAYRGLCTAWWRSFGRDPSDEAMADIEAMIVAARAQVAGETTIVDALPYPLVPA